MKWIPARPTVYRGIRMRSRLEADFARWLDTESDWVDEEFGDRWAYEPMCFAGRGGQYLPDFSVTSAEVDRDGKPAPGATTYIEVKPLVAAQGGQWPDDPIEDFLARLEIIWETDPYADLRLVFWAYKAAGPLAQFDASGYTDGLWFIRFPGIPFGRRKLLWEGRFQWADLVDVRGGLRCGPLAETSEVPE